PAIGEGPERFGAYCGCSDSREVWMSLASILAAFNAANTLAIAALLVSDASRAVLASVATPASTKAMSGATDILASPVTEIAGGKASDVCASAGSPDRTSAMATRAPLMSRPILYFNGT